jgi:diguanylate cyclase (GGDEF)-like protein
MASGLDISTRITRGSKLARRHPPARSRACLIQYSGDSLGRRYLLDAPEITIGRAPGNGIVLYDDSVSRAHARVTAQGDAVALEDLGSSNGTFIHDEPVLSRTVLKDGDVLRLGNILLKYFAHGNIENAFHDNIYRMATVDAGTQAYNKQYLLETLESEFRFCRVYGRALSVIYFDLDFFKKVNDAHGHACGDYVLRETVRVAQACLRSEDTLARYGGEEFVVLLPGTAVAVAAQRAEQMRQRIADHDFVFEGKTLKQTISAGVAENLPAFKLAADLLSDADQKLYQSKHGGRNRVTA